MSRKSFLNVLSLAFAPSVNEAFRKDIIGAVKKTWTLAAETTVSMDFTEHRFHEVLLGSAGITINAVVTGMEVGEIVFLKIVQDGTAARTVAFGTNIVTAAVVSATTDDVDLFIGVFDGTNIILGALAQNVA